MCKITVIVTVYNIENYIKECLTSILQQKYKNIEIIVVDDGSTDSSGIICDEFAQIDGRIKVIHQENQGPILARLHGVELATSDYITFVDGDDWIDENIYRDVVASNYLDSVDMVSLGIKRYRGENDILEEPYFFEEGIYTREKILKNMIPKLFWVKEKMNYGLDPSLCTKIFRKEYLLRHLQKVKHLNIHYGEDIAVIYPMVLEVNSIAIINRAYYYHRARKNNNVPPYIADDKYYFRLFDLYKYLKECFEKYGNTELLKQLDYFYMYSVEVRKLYYNDLVFESQYLFPFHKIPRGCKLVLYGAGRVGQTYFKQINQIKYCEVVGWVDRDYSIYNDSKITSVDSLEGMEYDYILISIVAERTRIAVENNLCQKGIGKEKIVSVWS